MDLQNVYLFFVFSSSYCTLREMFNRIKKCYCRESKVKIVPPNVATIETDLIVIYLQVLFSKHVEFIHFISHPR